MGNRTFKTLLWILCILFSVESIAATEDSILYYYLPDTLQVYPLKGKTQILIDDQSEYTIEKILEAGGSNLFREVDTSELLINGPKEIWLKLSVFAEKEMNNWNFLLISPLYYNKYISGLEYYDLYKVVNNEIVEERHTGIKVPKKNRSGDFIFGISGVKISIEKGEFCDFYIHLKDPDYVVTTLELRHPDIPIPIDKRDRFSQIVMLQHFSFIISIYVLCFFFYTRDLSYIYLFGLLMVMFIHFEFLNPFSNFPDIAFPNNPHLRELSWMILTTLSLGFFILFGREFANLKEISPKDDKIFRWLFWLLIATLILKIVIRFYDFEMARKLNSPSMFLFFMTTLIMSIRLLRLKNIQVNYFVSSAIWIAFFSMYGLLHNFGYLPDIIPINPWIIGNSGFILILALGIARKLQLSERAKSQVEKVREIDIMKSRFFANISHEFRTPLSLILGPIHQSLEAIPASDEPDDELEIPVKGKYLRIMKRNASRLQNLVNQILDLSKLDQGKMSLKVQEGNLIQFVRMLVFSFESMAERKNIHLITQFPKESESTWFDADKLEKILVNILSNAFKFTPENGKVGVICLFENDHFNIQISDTAGGLGEGESEKIFDRFYQVEGKVDEGTGIGLALVKELVDLYRGRIRVESTEGLGTTFKISLPFRKESFKKEEITSDIKKPLHNIEIDSISEFSSTNLNQNADAELPVILVVEDNPDLRTYVAEQLAEDYRVLLGTNGKEGLEIAIEKIPDLIISDVMMPEMDGMQLCKASKTNRATSHIPVILLTAQAGDEAKIQGLEYGADDYLTKPFNSRELLIRVKNLVEQRENLKLVFGKNGSMVSSLGRLSSMDERFLEQVKNAIEKNLSNEFYSVEELASDVGFSRSQLNRKIKAITTKSPNLLIREFRLTRAKQMLEQKTATVSEIAYEVGYSNLSYFSRSYKDYFGVNPSEV
jgi:signal transduction histidine kinase/DNA-binding response OmpR family regulator